ncbi:MAG: hypothetical protein ACJA1Z_002941 [Patiriisocius sp.]|jgi:hypothetical protein
MKMTDKSNIQIDQSQGIGSKGKQSIFIDQSTHHYSNTIKNLVKTHNGAITFDPNSLRDVIVVIAGVYDELEQKPNDFGSISIEEKNELNGLSNEFYMDIIARDYEPYFFELDSFLKRRENEDLQGLVGKIVKSLNKKISAGRKNFDSFEKLLLSIEEALLESKYETLEGTDDSISLFLFYLYANCYIGKKLAEEIVC